MTRTIANGKVMIEGKLEEKNVIIDNGKIVEISSNSSGEIIDAAGKIILPGLIDVHVHLREPGMTQKEDVRSGTMAAAAGGVTTVLEMPNTNPATTTAKLLEEKRKLMKGKAIANYGLYMGATSGNIEEIKKAKNIAGVKLYMGSSTGNLLVTDTAVIKNIFSCGKTAVVHAENEELIKKNTEKYKSESNPEVHVRIRSNEAAATAVKEAIGIAAECGGKEKVHITHASTKDEIELIGDAKKELRISCDVTPHHLFLTKDELKKQGNFAKMNPPLRSREDVEALWEAIENGVVDCIATDHAPHTKEEKMKGYWEAPSGVPGLETMLPLLLDAVNKKKISLEKVAELTSENPARIFGIKNKGKIEKGRDADLVIVDMSMEKEVRNDKLFTKCKWSPFNGWKLKGWPVMTIVNGKIVYNDEEIVGSSGREVEFQ